MPNNLTETSASYQVRIFSSFDEPELNASAWNDLVWRSDTGTIFQTYEWMTSWWKVFGDGRELLLIAVFYQDRLVGLAPMMQEFVDGTPVALAFIGEGNADYCDFLLTEPHLPALQWILITLADRRDRWQEVRLNNLPGQSFTAKHLAALCAEIDLFPLTRARIECPALVFGDAAMASKSIQRRQSLKRPLHYFRSQGEIEFIELTTQDQVLAQLDAFFEQHTARWRDSKTSSLFVNARNREFYRELVTRLFPTGWLVFSMVTLNGQALAYHFGFDYGHRYYWYKPSYNTDFGRHSPGSLLLRFLLLRAVERQCVEFDFTIGNEAFKHRYSNTLRRNLSLAIYPQQRTYVWKRLLLFVRGLLRPLVFWRRQH